MKKGFVQGCNNGDFLGGRLVYLAALGIGLMVGLTGCAAFRTDDSWQEPRPLGRDFTVYRPPEEPSDASHAEFEEPTGPITLREALSLALMSNPDLAAFSWEVRAAEARTLQAGLLPNPEFGAELENFAGSGPVQDLDETETTIQLSQLIETAGKRIKRRRVAALERDLIGWDYETRRIDVFTQVTQTFVDVLAAQERLALTDELLRLAGQVLNATLERVRAGKVSPVEETRAKVARSTIQIEWERAKRRLDAARQRLAGTWGGTSPTFEKVVGELDAIEQIPSADQLRGLISQNPDVARWATEMEQRRAILDLEKARRIPNLTIGGGVRHLNETDDNAFVAALSIPVPIYNRNQGGILEARYRLAKAERERKATEVRVLTALSNAYQTLSTAFVEATTLRNDVLPGAQSAFDAINEGYRQGKFSYLDVLDAQRTLVEVRGQYIESLGAYHKAVADVERLIGERLEAIKDVKEQKQTGGEQ